jgi:hypothetical protein
MDTIIIRVYTVDGNYHSTRQISIPVESLHDYIQENELKPNEILESHNLEEVK